MMAPLAAKLSVPLHQNPVFVFLLLAIAFSCSSTFLLPPHLTLSLTSAQAAEAICPLTGLKPAAPAKTLTRCVAYQALSCCSFCDDLSTAIKVVGRNGTEVTDIVLGSAAALLPGLQLSAKSAFCSFTAGHDLCLSLIESFYCAMLCDPNSESFVQVTNTSGTLYVCNQFAEQLFAACGPIQFPGLSSPISSLLTSPTILVQALVGPIAKATTSFQQFTAAVTPLSEGVRKCFNGPPRNITNPTNLCCDSLSSTPAECYTGKYNDTERYVADAVNRTLAPSCKQSDEGSISPPPSPPSPDGGKGSSRNWEPGLWLAWVLGAFGLVALYSC